MRLYRWLLLFALSLSTGLACAQMPITLMETSAPSHEDWARAAPQLRAAIECRQRLAATHAVRAVLRATNARLGGDRTFPEPLTVFGSIQVQGLSIFEDETGKNGHAYTIQPKGVTLAELVRAAGLKKAKSGLYHRQVKGGGQLEARRPGAGPVQLVCLWEGSED